MAVSAARDLPLGRGGDVSNFPRTVLTQVINQVDRAEGLWNLVSASPKVALPYPVSQGAGRKVSSFTHPPANHISLLVCWEEMQNSEGRSGVERGK